MKFIRAKMALNAQEELIDNLVAEYILYVEYIRMSTAVMSLLPVSYGILTFVFGDDLWGSSPVYSTALRVPWAPQSWGLLFFALGVVNVWCAVRRRHTGTAVCSVSIAVVMAMFMMTFLTETVVNHYISGVPPALVYAVFACAFLNRARLAWSMRRIE